MVEARETLGITIPFVIGVTIATFSLKTLYKIPFWLCVGVGISLLLTLLASCLLVLTYNGVNPKGVANLYTKTALWLVYLLAGCSVCLIAAIPCLQPIRERAGYIQELAQRFKSLIDSIPYRNDGTNALVKAFLTGDRSSLGYEVKAAFRSGGASHILALSGMHLGIIYLVVSKFLVIFGNSPFAVKSRSLLILVLTGFFTMITGASASLVRAFLFILLREFAVMTHRRAGNLNILCVALMLQLSVAPCVITAIGFQLSYLATLGMALLFPALDRLWDKATNPHARANQNIRKGNKTSVTIFARTVVGMQSLFTKSVRWVWSLSSLSIACQAFTAPAVLLYFGTFPQYFLITNLLCMPLSSAVIAVSLFTIPLHTAGVCPDFLLRLNDFLAETLVYVLKIVSSMNSPI